jgi:hypothetical protein
MKNRLGIVIGCKVEVVVRVAVVVKVVGLANICKSCN